MRAVVQHGTGGPEVLKVEERPEPARREGEVLIRVEAISVPFYETQLRAGMLSGGESAIFGHEAAGVVVEADDPELIGKRVVSMSYVGGAYAEVVASGRYTLVPEHVSAESAVAAAVPASVALVLFRTADVGDGETVLVEAASGSIGGYLTRLAKDAGARVVATAGAGKSVKGADVVLDHDDPDWRTQVPDGIDVVFESIGGPRAAEVLPKIVPRGRVLAYGLLSGEFPVITVADLIPRGLTLIGFGGPDAYGKDAGAATGEALGLVGDGTLTPVIDRTYALDDVVEAHARVESREGVGKVLLVP
ncbi:zinc-binding dehydrogenase [Amycolatopsis sp. NBC_00348]|uniref:quinone oxidoreductase family protein n=1 Tax=Amycolatopsis sp. NBC_00348 TaxID=2975956 RepID=UPI002E25598F